MIVVDTSAIMAIVLDEPAAEACMAALEAEDRPVMSAGTFAEILVVSMGRKVHDVALALIYDLGVEIVPVTAASVRRMADGYRRWGKGMNPASLNFGDCFAYEAARTHNCQLLYVGNDFARTDVQSALLGP